MVLLSPVTISSLLVFLLLSLRLVHVHAREVSVRIVAPWRSLHHVQEAVSFLEENCPSAVVPYVTQLCSGEGNGTSVESFVPRWLHPILLGMHQVIKLSFST